MIKDRVEHAMAYAPLGAGIARALKYIKETDFDRVEPGRYELEGRNVFAIVQRYQTKPLTQARWEAHRQHIDVQFIARGTERMGHLSLAAKPELVTPYDEANDIAFYKGGTDLLTFVAGDFAVFTPQDIHAPCLDVQSQQAANEVFKVVVKIRVNEKSGPCGF